VGWKILQWPLVFALRRTGIAIIYCFPVRKEEGLAAQLYYEECKARRLID
jgi:hypothetical protein